MLAPTTTLRRPPDRARRGAAGLGAAAAALTAATAVLYAVCVLTPLGQRHEDAVHSAASAAGGRSGLFGALAGAVESLRPVHFLAGLVLVTACAALRGRWVRAAASAGAVVVSLGLTEVLKHLVLPRPGLAGAAGATAHNSLPSGHTTAAVSLVLALLLALPSRARRVLALPGGLAAAVMAGAVVGEGWHRVSDALASVLLTAAVWCAACAVVALGERGARPPGPAAVAVAAVVPPLACAGALVVAYAPPGTSLAAAVAAPAVAALVAVLAAVPAAPGEGPRARRLPGGGRGGQRAG